MKKNTEADRERVFREYPVAKALRVMVVPAVVSQLIVLIYNMADTFYVGLTDNPYMIAGTSLILPVFNISLCLAGLAGVGGGALISRLLGQGREDEARRASVFSLYLAAFIAAAFAVGTGVFMDPLLKLLGAGENTYEYARQYALCVIVCGGVPTVLSNALASVVRSVGRSKEAGGGNRPGRTSEYRPGSAVHVRDPASGPGSAGRGNRHGALQRHRLPFLYHGSAPDGKGFCSNLQSPGRPCVEGERDRRVRGGRALGGGDLPV